MRVVFVVLDAFPNVAVGPAVTPSLWSLVAEGGWNPAGGMAEMTASTYPNHATFVTGASTLEHGILTNRVWTEDGWRPSSERGPGRRTLFDACAEAGLRSVGLFGDQHLVGVCGATAGDAHWPPGGTIPDGAERNVAGYLADREVLSAAASLDLASAAFTMVQFDAVDAARHVHGAESDEALDQCSSTDRALGELLAHWAPVWDDVVVMAVSDHDQEDFAPGEAVNLRAQLPEHLAVEHQGTSALVLGEVDPAEILAVAGVAGVESLDATRHVVWGGPGQAFGSRTPLHRADHGSPRTRTQVAVVGGGHPAATRLAREVAAQRPPAASWAGWVAELLDLDLGT